MRMSCLPFSIVFVALILIRNVSMETTTELDEGYTTVGSNFTVDSSICDLNGTCTDLNVSTTPKPTVKPTKKLKNKEKEKRGRELQFTEQNSICTCDLMAQFCDLNCCCDKDCTANDKKLFTHCIQEENLFYDTRYCDFMKYIYVNNTQVEWQVNQNGLFCIIKRNVPKSYTVHRMHALRSLGEVEELRKAKFSWFEEDEVEESEFSRNEQFVYGNVVWLIDENHRMSKLSERFIFVTLFSIELNVG